MKKILAILSYMAFVAAALSACCKDTKKLSDLLGKINADLDANKNIIRTREALIGNMICDGIKSELDRRGESVDFIVINAGAVRYNEGKRPSGIYPAGDFTSDMIDEMLPFGDDNVIVTINGKQLKSIFERSVAQLPQAEGPFLQMSRQLTIKIDTTMPPQVINELVDPPTIVTEGKRITSIKINGTEYDSTATYRIGVSSFMVDESGNDGFVTLRNIPPNKKLNLGDEQAKTIKQYIQSNAPITPSLSGRIGYQ